MKSYYRTPEMAAEKEFRCPNCRKLLVRSVNGAYELILNCPRCKAEIRVKTVEPILGGMETDVEIKESA